jgi:hypothetical protein
MATVEPPSIQDIRVNSSRESYGQRSSSSACKKKVYINPDSLPICLALFRASFDQLLKSIPSPDEDWHVTRLGAFSSAIGQSLRFSFQALLPPWLG